MECCLGLGYQLIVVKKDGYVQLENKANEGGVEEGKEKERRKKEKEKETSKVPQR